MPPWTVSSEGHREAGTASVESIAVVPFLLLAVLVAAQIGVVGGSLWSAAVAARAGARAALVEGDSNAVARRALPIPLRREARVRDSHGIAVSVPVPKLLPIVPDLAVDGESELGGG